MSGFQIWIPKEALTSFHQRYSSPNYSDVLNMKWRIEQHLNTTTIKNECKDSQKSHLQGENSSHSTTEANVVHDQISVGDEDDNMDVGIMDRADVLFKYILRSFRKYYCK